MKKLCLSLLVFFSGLTFAQTTPTIALCDGDYALCAASTCTRTGKTITTNDGQVWPEVVCTCPILKGKAIADLTGGNMKGSCAAPSGQVWSLFAPKVFYPQEASNFVTTPKSATKASVQACSGKFAPGSTNCWSMICNIGKTINGSPTAECKCPIQQIKFGTEFLTEAGQGDASVCTQHPVAAPDVFAEALVKKTEQSEDNDNLINQIIQKRKK
jgi:hypothetical protein